MAGRQDAVLNVGASLVQGTQQAFAAIAKGFAAISKGMKANADSMRALGDAAGASKFDKFSKAMADASHEVSDQVAALDKLGTTYDKTAAKGEKLAAATEKRTKALAKEASEAKKAAATQKTAGGATTELDAAAIQKQTTLIEHLNLSYKELIHSTEVYGLEAKKVMTQLHEGDIDPLRAADQIQSLHRRRNAYQKLSVELKALTALYPKEAAILANSDKSYQKQVDILNKLKIAKEKIAVTSQKQAQADEKALIKSAAALAKTQNQVKGLTFDYAKLLNSQTKYGSEAQQLVGSLLGMGTNFSLVSKKIRRLNQEFKTSQMSAEQTAVAYQKLAKKYPGFQQRIKEYQRLGKDVNKLKEALERLHKIRQRVEKTRSDNRKRAQQIQLLALKYDKLINSTDKYGKRARQIQALLKRDPALIDRVSKSYEVLAKRQERAFKAMTPLQQGMQRLGKSFKTYLSYMAASSAIFAVLQVFREATTTVIEYDQALKDLQAITQSTDEDVAAMGETIKQVASDTKFSAVETAEGMKLLGQSGLSATESIETIAAVANLATGTLTDMDTTVDLMTTTMRVFGVKAEDSARISDVWANAVNRSKLTIDKIRTAMNYIGPVASAVGISLEETAGSMMIMANQGIRASTIGTGLRQVFRRLVDPSKEMTAAMSEAGLTMADMDPQAVGLEQVFDNLKLIVQDSGDAFRMFGQRGATAVLAITKKGGAALEGMLEIVHRTGTSVDMAATQMEGLGVSFKNLQDKVKNLYIAMGENGLAGSLRIFVDLARGFVDFLTGVFSSAWVQLGTKILLVASAATALGKAFLWLSAIIKAQYAAAVARAGTAMGSYTVATLAAGGATNTFTASLVRMKAALAATGIGLFIIALGSAVSYASGLGDGIADAGREFKAMGLKIQDNITALEGMKKALNDNNTTTEQVTSFTKKLAEKYKDYKERIEAAGGSTEEITIILDELIEKEKQLSKSNTAESFKNNIKGMLNAAVELESHKGFDGFLRKLLGIDNKKVIDESKKELQKLADEAVEIFLKAKKDADGNLTIEDFLKSSAGKTLASLTKEYDDVSEALALAVEKSEKKAAAKAEKVGRTVGEAIVDGVILAKTPEELAAAVTDFKDEFKKALQTEETALAKSLYKIEELEARGIITHEAADMQKLNTTIGMYDKMLSVALEYQRKAEDSGNADLMAAAAEKVSKATENAYKARLDKLKKFGQEREKIEAKLATQEKKSVDEIEKHKTKYDELETKRQTKRLEKIENVKKKEVELWETYEDKKKEIARKLEETLDDLREKRKAAEQETVADVASIGDTIDDKITGVQQRGLEGKALETSKDTAALNRYNTAEKAFADAKKNRDLEALGRAQKLYEKSGDYYESLKDSGRAVSGLKKVGRALQEARELQGELEVEAIDAEIAKAKEEADRKTAVAKTAYEEDLANYTTKQDEKLTKALSVINQQQVKEDARHTKAMANIDAEILKLQQKHDAVTAQQKGVLGAGAPGTTVGVGSGGFNQAEFDAGLDAAAAGAIPDISAYVEDGVKEGIDNGVHQGEWAEAGQSIAPTVAEGVKSGVFDGVQVEGMSLEEWKAKGREQGAALGQAVGHEIKEQLDFKIIEIFDDDGNVVPVEVQLTGIPEGGAEELTTDIQAALDKYPGEPTLDFTVAEQMIEAFIRDVEREYTVNIPVQAQADGGPVMAMAKGGRIPGQDSPEDKVHVMARPGEWFIKNEAVKSWNSSVGDWFMKGVNWPGSDAGKRLHELLDLNGSIAVQNRNIKKLASNAMKQDSGMGDFGTINFNLPTEGPAVPAQMRPNDASELMRQLGKMGRLAS